MSKLWCLVPLLVLGACNNYTQGKKKLDGINKELNQKGFAVVGKTPDGRPLLMTTVDGGLFQDRVYFAGDSITAVEDCGKSCVKSVPNIPPRK